MGKEQKASLIFLDGLRGFAAIYVMIGHARWFLWEGGEAYSHHVSDYSIFEKIQVYFFGLFKYGHQMVLFFFVLSGFVIHLKQAKSLKAEAELRLEGYFWRRARRIIPPFFFALAITFACDKIVEYMGASIYTHSTPDTGLNSIMSFDHSLPTLIGNIFFLQQTYVPVFGSNGPLWSLKYEWWFYMLYPVFLFLNKKHLLLALLTVFILSVLSICGWSWGIKLIDDVFAYFFCWWLGCLCADIYAGRIHVPQWVSILASFALITIPFHSKLDFQNIVISDTIVAIGFFGLLSLLLSLHSKGVRFRVLERLKIFGDCSYTLYVIHGPLLVVANGILLGYTGNQLPQSFLFVWISIIVLIIFAYLAHFITEKPFVTSPVKRLEKVKA